MDNTPLAHPLLAKHTPTFLTIGTILGDPKIMSHGLASALVVLLSQGAFQPAEVVRVISTPICGESLKDRESLDLWLTQVTDIARMK